MQTLNVGAGRSEEDYKADEAKRRADRISDSRDIANFFFWAAGAAALGTGLLPVQLNFAVNIGFIDLIRLYGTSLGSMYRLALLASAGVWVLLILGLGLAARRGQRWAFWAGIVLYAADMIPLIMTFSIWAFGVHAFFLFKWFQGQGLLQDLKEPSLSANAS